MATTFKRRPISKEDVARAETAAADSPLVQQVSAPEKAPEFLRHRPSATTPSMDPEDGVFKISSPSAKTQSVEQPQTEPARLVAQQDHFLRTLVVGQVVEVPTAWVRSNPVNPRVFYTAAMVESMAESLRERGQQTAALGFVDGDNLVLIDGETRLRGARAAGMEVLRVEIRPRPATNQELHAIAYVANEESAKPTGLDYSVRWRALLEDGTYANQAELARSLHQQEALVSRILSIGDLPRDLMLEIIENPGLCTSYMLSAIREYWAVAGDLSTRQLIAEIVEKGLGYRDVSQRRKMLQRGPVRRPPSSKIPFTFRGVRGELRTVEDDGRVELVVKGLSAEDAQALSDRLQNALREASLT